MHFSFGNLGSVEKLCKALLTQQAMVSDEARQSRSLSWRLVDCSVGLQLFTNPPQVLRFTLVHKHTCCKGQPCRPKTSTNTNNMIQNFEIPQLISTWSRAHGNNLESRGTSSAFTAAACNMELSKTRMLAFCYSFGLIKVSL